MSRLVEHDRGVEPRAEPLGQRGLAEADRALDGEVAKVHAEESIGRDACDTMAGHAHFGGASCSIVRLPLVRPFETSFGRIDAREFVLVAVDADGATGWGECVADVDPFYSAETTTTAWHVLSSVPRAVRCSADRSAIRAKSVGSWTRVRGHRMAKAALEMAVWDLHARLEGRPLCEVLGAQPRPIAAGVSIGIQPSTDALVERVAAELADGLPAHQDQDQAGLGPSSRSRRSARRSATSC